MCGVFLLDSQFALDASKFVGGTLMCNSTEMQFLHVHVCLIIWAVSMLGSFARSYPNTLIPCVFFSEKLSVSRSFCHATDSITTRKCANQNGYFKEVSSCL